MKYRYREPDEMKESGVEWLGKIPKEWESKKSKYIFKETSIKGFPDEVMLASSQKKGVIPKKELENRATEALKNFENFKLVKTGNFVISLRSFEGGIEYSKYQGIISPAYTVMELNKQQSKSFFKYLLKEKKFIQKLNSLTVGIRDGKNISYKNFSEVIFYLGLKGEQQKISDFLNQKTVVFDTVIEKKEKLIEKLEEAKKSLISEVVTGKKRLSIDESGQLKVENRPTEEMKDSGVEWLGMIPKEWKGSKVKYEFKFFRGLAITKADLKDEGVQCLNYGEIHSKYSCFINTKNNNLKKVSEEYLKTNSNSLLKNGDLVFADTSEDLKGSGNFTYIGGDENIFAGYHTVTIRSNENKPNKYARYLFDSMDIRQQIQYKVKGVKVYSITQSILKDIFILKSKEEQKIAEFLDRKTSKFDSIIQKNKDQIKKIKEAKQSLISEAVTGKIEVM